MSRALLAQPLRLPCGVDLPNRFAKLDIDIRTNVKLFDDMLQSFWYNHQMKRMGRGLNPDIRASKWIALMKGMSEQIFANPFAQGRSYPYPSQA